MNIGYDEMGIYNLILLVTDKVVSIYYIIYEIYKDNYISYELYKDEIIKLYYMPIKQMLIMINEMLLLSIYFQYKYYYFQYKCYIKYIIE